MSRLNIVALAIIAGFLICSSSQASIIFDDFNAGVGTHFNGAPQSSGTTNILSTATTGNLNATTSTTDAFEGGKALNIHVQGGGQSNVSPSFARIRFLSGGGTPANNVAFTTTAGTDGWIGFYYKVPAAGTLPNSLPAGLQLQINLDGTSMDSGVPINAIMDGDWHLAEWNLDDAPSWQATPGIGGDGVLSNGESHTIDSIYFRYPVGTAWAGFTGQEDLQIDFVAKSDSGSIANLVPEPASLGLLAVGALGLLRRRR